MMENNTGDWKNNPEEGFGYEELTDKEILYEEENTENIGQDNSEDSEEDDWGYDDGNYDEDDTVEEEGEDDFDDDGDIVIRFRPWMIPAFAGMMILAILICIPLWSLSHPKQNNDKILVAVDNTESVMADAASEQPEIENTPEAAESVSGTTESNENMTTPEPTAAPDVQNTAEPTDDPQVQNTEVPAATDVPYISGDASMTFAEVSESVTAKDVTNLRTSPSTTDSNNVVGKLRNGEVLTRTGQNADTGWSRLEYNGQTVYAVSSYLVTDLAYTTPETPTDPNRVSTQDGRVIVFTNCDDYITPKDTINLRTEPSTSEGESTVRTQVKNGTNLHRTGDSGESGWSRVEYNGEILYAVTNYVISGSAPE